MLKADDDAESQEWTISHILSDLSKAGYRHIYAQKGEYGSGPQWERDLCLFNDVAFGRVDRGENRTGGPWVLITVKHMSDDGQRAKRGEVVDYLLAVMRKSTGHLFICQETASEIEIRMP